jgi:rsbT co-antagonist protein RsbR
MDVMVDAGSVRARICQVITARQPDIRQGWMEHLLKDGQIARIDRLTLDDICNRLLAELLGDFAEVDPPRGRPLSPAMCDLLSGISIDFVERGFTPSRTATFIFSLKRPLFPLFADDPEASLATHEMIDAMGLHSMDAFILRREQIIRRQTEELLDISVPVVPLWEGILSLPIIGTLDSGRAQAITEKLLNELARTASRHAVLDISGVPTVDTQTAQYLAKTAAAARLMGAECVITGIRPAIAQVMVALGINLVSIETRFSLAEGLRYCFAQQGLTVVRRQGA